jgi:hypothetical protein
MTPLGIKPVTFQLVVQHLNVKWKGVMNYSKSCLEDGDTLFVAVLNGLLHVSLDEAGCNNVIVFCGLQGAARMFPHIQRASCSHGTRRHQ